MTIAIVGAGIMGSSAALAATRRGHTVTIYDHNPPGHTRGSSHGNSRIVRRDYPDPLYASLMNEAYPLWAELDALLGGGIFHPTGLVYFGDPASPNIQNLVQNAQNNRLPHRLLDHQTIAEAFPALHLEPGEVAVHNPEAGWAHAHRAVTGSLNYALALGATFVPQRADPQKLLQTHDAVLVAAGAWAKALFHLPVNVHAQTFAYLQLPPDHNLPDQTLHRPVWIEDTIHGIYGFPPEPGANTVKFGVHSPGPEIDPDQNHDQNTDQDPLRQPHPAKLDLLLDFARRRFKIEKPRLRKPQTCLYTNAPDDDFLFAEPEPGLFYASPCSGHGFKFGPWVGNRLVDFAEGKAHPRDIPRLHHMPG